MSYARMGAEGSDVYVYLATDGFRCHWCALGPNDPRFQSTVGIITHLDDHRAAGHTVPQSCYDEIEQDRIENDRELAD